MLESTRAALRAAGTLRTVMLESTRAALRAAGVFAGVEQDVAEREPHFSWRLQRSRVVAVGKKAPFSRQLAIDGASDTNRETLNSAGERSAVTRLCNQVQVIALHREVHERKTEVLLALRQGLAHCAEQRVLAQRGYTALHAQGDVQGMMARMRRPAQMGDAGRAPVRGTSGTGTRASPGPKLETELPSSPHHELELALIFVVIKRLRTCSGGLTPGFAPRYRPVRLSRGHP